MEIASLFGFIRTYQQTLTSEEPEEESEKGQSQSLKTLFVHMVFVPGLHFSYEKYGFGTM